MLQTLKAQACVRVMLECTDPRPSARLQDPMRMQKFLDAALMHCELYPNNIAFVLKRLGAPQTAGLQRLREISRSSKAIRVMTLISYSVRGHLSVQTCLPSNHRQLLPFAGRREWSCEPDLVCNLLFVTPRHPAFFDELRIEAVLQPSADNCSRQS